MQVRRGTGRVNALDVRDQQASVGHRDTLPEAGRDMLQMYPAEAQKRAQLGGAALLAHRGPEGLRVAGRTAHELRYGRTSGKKVLPFGEEVLAMPLRHS